VSASSSKKQRRSASIERRVEAINHNYCCKNPKKQLRQRRPIHVNLTHQAEKVEWLGTRKTALHDTTNKDYDRIDKDMASE